MKALFFLMFICFFSFAFANDLKRNGSLKVVVDNKNKLMWMDDSIILKQTFTHKEAEAYCEELTYAGFSNWRVPDIDELKLIVDKKNQKTYINRSFRFNIADGFWASKAHWRTFWFYADYMYFISGTPYFDSRHKKKYVRCVRDI
ncbi:DUF1566 domain-containing protein [Halarcobacter bivalviorum]|uniref:DUF1566 domain-containing protein n=1 Tax=Halarcobacter bivalviorum TaxID=663364 RepID=A0AAX2A5N9_9BACT|nr:DUF1566 domain-containing protein [Halarcobacter bivalviorum]AXH11268.1 DUF1566 domain-containing protein [Halarcobacter bivalviorum]RXK09537.1 hypothetical protein CRV05_09515 [Halarcobacter bivalviorum]